MTVTVAEDWQPVVADDAPARSATGCSTASPRRSANAATATPPSPTSSGTPAPPSAPSMSSSPARKSASSSCCAANNEDLIASIRAAVDPEADWHQQIRQAVDAYVDHIESRPAITLSWIREAPALGAVAAPLHRLAMSR